jgi:hypothetical protein
MFDSMHATAHRKNTSKCMALFKFGKSRPM